MSSLKNKNCNECGTPILGRTDTRSMRNINNVLRRNRRILMNLSSRGRKKIRREKLLALGFDFTHVTSLKPSRNGKQYYYCYEQGYLPLEKGYFRLITKKDSESI
jgi:hypothetical protein